ncbi:hypothetical protein [Streptacidiphilus sp. EB103A]|uniref:hypothetical protein n=1 Tax=Streptacidiphilus sp. EB103A TaxID=3156275 RepID=UPI0035195134
MKPAQPLPTEGPPSDVLRRLQRELWFARDAGETRRVQDLTRQIGQLRTQATPEAPQREDTAAADPRRETTRKTAAPRKTAARKPKPRSSRVPRQ